MFEPPLTVSRALAGLSTGESSSCFAIVGLVLALINGCSPGAQKQDEMPQPVDGEHARWAALQDRLTRLKECERCGIANVQLEGADLRGARLRGASLQGRMKGADFRRADLTDVHLAGDLEGADFREAKVDGLWVYGAKLIRARLDGLDLRSVHEAPAADWSYATLQGANLSHVGFAGPGGEHRITPQTHALSVPIGGASLRGTDLRDADLTGAGLTLSDLRDADLRGANLKNAWMPTNVSDLEGAKLSNAVGPWGLRCAETSVGACVPTGTPTELRDLRQRMKSTCANGFHCEH